ncbi:MAG TPA: tyrosine-type recombinase/integrase [Planctomycetaceae bacterium]|nr:tyrosine-type recombinase/integrase [Planctomycetaceae bacterium]
MQRAKGLPSYRLHKASGQARAIVNGRHYYLGLYGSPESHDRFAELIAECVQQAPPPQASAVMPSSRPCPTVNELILAYWEFAKAYYTRDGEPTMELTGLKYALQPLRRIFGNSPANEFGPKKLKDVRQHMISVQDLARTEINKRIGRIKRAFKWAVAEELVLPSVYQGLQAVAGLQFGRTKARETDVVRPVADKDVDAILPYVSPQIRALIQVQRLAGMRPGEAVIMRPCDVDRTEEVWTYEPSTHKNRWRGHRRLIPLGPKAQAILLPFLDRDPNGFVFSPKEAHAWQTEQRAAASGRRRKTKIFPSELRARQRRKELKKKRIRRRPLRDRYDVDSYRRAVEYGVKRARKAGHEVMNWHPNQLRHAKATELRKRHGLEAAQVVLGHARVNTTEFYAEKNAALAREIARHSG